MNQETIEAIGRLKEAVASKQAVKTFLGNNHTASVVEVQPGDIRLAYATIKNPDSLTDAMRVGVGESEENVTTVFVNVADLARLLAKTELPRSGGPRDPMPELMPDE